jgi:hypothetical protein
MAPHNSDHANSVIAGLGFRRHFGPVANIHLPDGPRVPENGDQQRWVAIFPESVMLHTTQALNRL